jgi:hypothetical protein
MVDDQPYGMTVHHMLDEPPQIHTEGAHHEHYPAKVAEPPDLAAWYERQQQQQQHESEPESESSSSGSSSYACEFSDSESDASESAITSQTSQDDEDSDSGGPTYDQPGDIPGIEPGCGDGFFITQPAFDDVSENTYTGLSPDTQHLERCKLGVMYASSGIRRRREEDSGLLHEVDWALFHFREDRRPHENDIHEADAASAKKAGKRASTAQNLQQPSSIIHPTTVVPTMSLPGLEVQCVARTSGLQQGHILHALVSLKIYGRKSPSDSYQVIGRRIQRDNTESSKDAHIPFLGVPGDSGAWIIDSLRGQLCGHVLAWSERKRVAYICPMEVMLADIAETLEAYDICLPGGETLVGLHSDRRLSAVSALTDDTEGELSHGSLRGRDSGYTAALDSVFVSSEHEHYDGQPCGLEVPLRGWI